MHPYLETIEEVVKDLGFNYQHIDHDALQLVDNAVPDHKLNVVVEPLSDYDVLLKVKVAEAPKNAEAKFKLYENLLDLSTKTGTAVIRDADEGYSIGLRLRYRPNSRDMIRDFDHGLSTLRRIVYQNATDLTTITE